MTGIGFTGLLPSGLLVSTPNGLAGSWPSGAITATAGANSITLSGATLAASALCSFSVTVHGVASGFIKNTTSPVTSIEGGNGAPAQATTIVQDLSTIGLTSSQNPSTLGQPVTFTATVTPAGATGKVTFSFGSTLIGTALDASGKATLTTALLPSGIAPVTAIYSGDAGAAPSSSFALQQTVNALQATGLAPAVYYRTGTGPVGPPQAPCGTLQERAN